MRNFKMFISLISPNNFFFVLIALMYCGFVDELIVYSITIKEKRCMTILHEDRTNDILDCCFLTWKKMKMQKNIEK